MPKGKTHAELYEEIFPRLMRKDLEAFALRCVEDLRKAHKIIDDRIKADTKIIEILEK